MKTIEITLGNQKAQFTTKSVTFDDKEFLYSNMSDLIHNTEERIYTFTYDGEIKTLPYEEKDAKVLNAIFKQVQGIQAKKKEAEAAAAAKMEKPAQKNASEEPNAAGKAEVPKEKPGGEKTEPAVEADNSEKKKQKQSVKDIFAVAKKEKTEAVKKEKEEQKDSLAENMAADPERQARLKKSFTIFGVIVAAVVAVSLIYYFAFGTSKDPTPANPNVTESQQYDDIDELIDDLQ